MNTITIKRFGILAAGGVIGGLIGYFLAEVIIDQLTKSEELENEDTDQEQPMFRKSEGGELRVGKSEKPKEKIDYTKYATEKGDLSKLVEPYKESKQNNIRIISLDEYDSDPSPAKEQIAYYEGDTTFCNENEEIISNPEDYFGPNIHLHFGEDSEDADIVYVKNENNGVSYEITQIHAKYHVVVLGMPDEEPKTTKAKRRKTKKVNTLENEESIENEGED